MYFATEEDSFKQGPTKESPFFCRSGQSKQKENLLQLLRMVFWKQSGPSQSCGPNTWLLYPICMSRNSMNLTVTHSCISLSFSGAKLPVKKVIQHYWPALGHLTGFSRNPELPEARLPRLQFVLCDLLTEWYLFHFKLSCFTIVIH